MVEIQSARMMIVIGTPTMIQMDYGILSAGSDQSVSQCSHEDAVQHFDLLRRLVFDGASLYCDIRQGRRCRVSDGTERCTHCYNEYHDEDLTERQAVQQLVYGRSHSGFLYGSPYVECPCGLKVYCHTSENTAPYCTESAGNKCVYQDKLSYGSSVCDPGEEYADDRSGIR